MNNVQLLGRLVKDPDVKYTQSGKVVAGFTLAVTRPFKAQDGKTETDFIPCQLWGKTAETLGNTVKKGQRVLVNGRIQVRKYTDKTGATRYATEVICGNFEYIETKGQSQQQQDGFDDMGQQQPFDEEIPF